MIFDAIDTNSDNAIAADEFAAYFSSLSVNDAAFAKTVFQAMDANNDGVLSKDGKLTVLRLNNMLILIVSYKLIKNLQLLEKNSFWAKMQAALPDTFLDL